MLIKMQETLRSLFRLMVDKDLKLKSVCNSLGRGKIQMSKFPPEIYELSEYQLCSHVYQAARRKDVP